MTQKNNQKEVKKENTEEVFEKTKLSLDEGEVLEFWNKNNIFKKSIEQREGDDEFTFYDGPPFATGTPHYGHIVPGTIKDVFPRYKAMKGFHVKRDWGWDCHGMPIENIVEKKHKLNSKEDIEKFGVDNFCASARESIFTYKDIWEETIPRTGRFVDMEKHYKTMDPSYTESVWWGFSQFAKKGLLKKDFKPMHVCPRCETTLSNRDVSEGYKDIKDLTVTAKFELLDEDKKGTGIFVLAWTTTPWTLPGNVALAVGEDIDYVQIEKSDQESGEKTNFIVAKNLLEKIFPKDKNEYKVFKEFKGKDLIGKSYEPLFDYYSKDETLENRENGWKIYGADFITDTDGTGIGHEAPAFGEDDLELGRKNNLPWVQHVGIDGRFKKEVTDFAGMQVRKKEFHEEVDIEIIKNLAHAGKLFHKEKYEHSYPHCWRCDTPLLNYATSSWFLDVPAVRDKLVEENKKVNWVPDYVGHKRFANWLENARPWAVSRSRYWGTPIPIWENKDSGDYKVMGSLGELKEKTSNKNNFVLFRHGESEGNLKDILSFEVGSMGDKLTLDGKKMVEENTKGIEGSFSKSKNENGEKIDIIFVSPFNRTKETVEIIKDVLAFDGEVVEDKRLRETDFGQGNNGQSNDIYRKVRDKENFDFETKLDGGESLQDIKNRMMEFFYEVEKKYKGKNILVVTHHLPTLVSLQGLSEKEGLEYTDFKKRIPNAMAIDFPFAPIPHNAKYELDYHKPFIDQISFEEDGKKYEFIGDVLDTWFDSGSMSFASKHYPFENKDKFNPEKGVGYPADFISEGLDQTRGWFYVSMVIGYVLFGKSPYKNVVVHGMLMAEDGKKMSKSLKNYPPMDKVLNKYGADSLRLFLLTSSIVRGDSPAFMEKGVDEVSKKIIMKSKNILSFYNMYKDKISQDLDVHKSKNILDIWIIERTEKLINDVTKGLEAYTLDEAARPFFDFVDDFSTWYVRRSRDRYKGKDEEDRNYSLLTTKWVLKNFAKTIAPFAPFLADILWKDVKNENEKESVHLEDWPKTNSSMKDKISQKISSIMPGKEKDSILKQTEELREIVSRGLDSRVEAGIKVRQPLAQALVLPVSDSLLRNEQFAENIKDELNIKDIVLLSNKKDLTEELKAKFSRNDDSDLEKYFTEENKGANKEIKVVLDTEMTDDLAREGDFRELLRQVQVMRKKAKMNVEDRADLKVDLMGEDKAFIEENMEELENTAGIVRVNFSEIDGDDNTAKINKKEIKIILIK